MDPVVDIPGLLSLWQSANGGDPEIRIAVIEGPVDRNHTALRNARLTADQGNLEPQHPIRSEHGTHVTSIIAGDPGGPVRGVAPNCAISLYSIYREGDDGELLPSSQAELALAINRAVSAGAHLINISSGQQSPDGQAERILADAVRAASRANTLIVAAAGNDGCSCLQVPAALGSVLAVGACDLSGRPLPFSNFGAGYLENGILAPGELVNGASVRDQVAQRSGTSFATPIVTGIIALLLTRQRRGGLKVDPRAARAALLESAIPCSADAGVATNRCLTGRLNVSGALEALLGADTDARRSMSTRQQLAPAAGQEYRNRSITIFKAPSEDTMTDLANTAAIAPRILGPDGRAVSASGIAPSEARPDAPAPQTVVPSEARGAPVVEASVAAPSQTAGVFPMSANTLWVPVSMNGIATPGSAQVPAGVVAPAAFPQALMPASAGEPAVSGRGGAFAHSGGADCRCGDVRPSQAQETQLAFPIGRLYYDFGTEARLDYFVQAIASWRDSLDGRGDPDFGPARDKSADVAAPYDPEIMGRYLVDIARGEEPPRPSPRNLQDANAIIWTLTIDTIPIYAIKPLDVFGLGFYSSLVVALANQEIASDSHRALFKSAAQKSSTTGKPEVERVTVAGWLTGATTTLLNGTVLPTLTADWRGFYQWNINNLLQGGEEPQGFRSFLERIYNEFRNVGVSPQDRALNYSAINAHNTKKIFKEMAQAKMRLDSVEVDSSVICRPGSQCFDVTYRFFDPTAVLTQARKVFQQTCDVRDTHPVIVGQLREWEVY